jgi:hypothetical protein
MLIAAICGSLSHRSNQAQHYLPPLLWPCCCCCRQAVGGIDKLKDNVDTLIIIPNDQLLAEVQDRSTSLTDAFKLADTVLLQVRWQLLGQLRWLIGRSRTSQ